jgi:NADH dehydrogenase [ubiquinone] 1 alpha subcomplex assembly factor 1
MLSVSQYVSQDPLSIWILYASIDGLIVKTNQEDVDCTFLLDRQKTETPIGDFLVSPNGSYVLFDFARPDALPWLSVDDGVMGGVSQSRMQIENDRAVFKGNLSIDFGGGFASVRSAPVFWDLSAFKGISLILRGDGRRYNLILKSDAGLGGINWQAPFQTIAGERQVVHIPFEELTAVYRGSPVMNPPLFDSRRIATIGILISDKQAGQFRLEIERITAN